MTTSPSGGITSGIFTTFRSNRISKMREKAESPVRHPVPDTRPLLARVPEHRRRLHEDPGRGPNPKGFSSVHHVVPPSSVDRYVAPSNQHYLNALLTLQTSVDQAAQMPTPDPAGKRDPVQRTSAKIRSSRSRRDSTSIRTRTSKRPCRGCSKIRSPMPKSCFEHWTGRINGKGKGLCAAFSAVTNKYLFNLRPLQKHPSRK